MLSPILLLVHQRTQRASEVEKVIDTLTTGVSTAHSFYGQLDYFYGAIEAAAQELTDFRERQTFINAVYEQFFQRYAVKRADTHVYTPQPIMDFMCVAVEEVLRDEFGLALHRCVSLTLYGNIGKCESTQHLFHWNMRVFNHGFADHDCRVCGNPLVFHW